MDVLDRKINENIISLNYLKVEQTQEITINNIENSLNYIKNKLKETEVLYDLEISDEIFNGALRLSAEAGLKKEFFDDLEKGLFLLSITTFWLKTKSFKDKRRLLKNLKLISVGWYENEKGEKDYMTSSEKVKTNSKKGFKKTQEFDPDYKNLHSKRMKNISDYIKVNENKELKKEVWEKINDWSENGILYNVRKKLGITKDNEKPFEILILDVSLNNFEQNIGHSAMMRTIETSKGENVKKMIFSKEHIYESLEHEYVHTQGIIATGYKCELFEGLNEALTENATTKPISYLGERLVLKDILDKNTDYEELFYKSYTGDDIKRVELFSKLIKGYGLSGFIDLADITEEKIKEIEQKIKLKNKEIILKDFNLEMKNFYNEMKSKYPNISDEGSNFKEKIPEINEEMFKDEHIKYFQTINSYEFINFSILSPDKNNGKRRGKKKKDNNELKFKIQVVNNDSFISLEFFKKYYGDYKTLIYRKNNIFEVKKEIEKIKEDGSVEKEIIFLK